MSKATIWAKLKAKGFDDNACAAIMGNMQAESAFLSNNVEDRCSMSDEAYTAAVDNGSYSRDQFVRDAYGYGLCQWTYYTRKAGLYDFAKSKGVSVADEQMQIDWMWEELHQGEYYPVLQKLTSGETLFAMTKWFMCKFENPADQSDSAINYRYGLAQRVYYELAGTETTEVTEATEATEVTEVTEPDGPATVYRPRSRVLCEGMSGTDVSVLQALLLSWDYQVEVTGEFDARTRAMTMAYQAEHNLDPDGIAGPLTFAALGVTA